MLSKDMLSMYCQCYDMLVNTFNDKDGAGNLQKAQDSRKH